MAENSFLIIRYLIVKGSQVAVLGKKEDDSHVIANDFKPYKQWLHDREIR
mgnify:CR=1 FL=1